MQGQREIGHVRAAKNTVPERRTQTSACRPDDKSFSGQPESFSGKPAVTDTESQLGFRDFVVEEGKRGGG